MVKRIDLEGILHSTALTSSWEEHRLDAAVFCLNHNKHKPGIGCWNTSNQEYGLFWSLKITPAIKRTFKDVPMATEMGAEGMAALFTDELTPFQVIERSAKSTGIDYYLAYRSSGAQPLIYQKAARLEVSGLINGSQSQFNKRIRDKKKQTLKSKNTGLPAYIAVTDFGVPRIAFEKV